jgi:phage gp36-like protein
MEQHMATYTTIADLEKRLDSQILAGLADDVNTPPDLADAGTQAVLEKAIADGASLIDSYLLGRVDLSNQLVCAALERLNATLALYFLYQRRYVDDKLNPLALSKEAILGHLAAVLAGTAKIADGADGSPELVVYSTTEDSERVLDAGKLRRF